MAFGNSTGDRQMLEYAKATGGGAGISTIVLHDDAEREYAYGSAQGLPNTKVGAFTPALDDEEDSDDAQQFILPRRDNPIVAWHEVPGKTPLQRTVP
jgi:hypothetical protein